MFKPLSLTARLSAATGIFWLGFVILAALSLQGLHSMSRDLQLVHDTHMQASQAAARLRQLIQDNRTEVLLTYQHAPDSPVADVHDHPADLHHGRLLERREKINAEWETLRALSSQPQDQAIAAQVGQAMEAWMAKSDAATEALRQGRYADLDSGT